MVHSAIMMISNMVYVGIPILFNSSLAPRRLHPGRSSKRAWLFVRLAMGVDRPRLKRLKGVAQTTGKS